MFEFYLRLGKSKPGGQAFATYLKTYYQGKISTLNHEWGTSHASFEKIPGTRPPKRYSMHMQQGIILGIRYKGVPDVALFTALSPYFDVNSINDSNRYGHLKPVYTTLYKATGKPLMLTEFSFFGFPSPGHTSALFIDVYTQANRGIGYHKYTLQAARARFMVGMHWFMWMDYAKQKAVTKGYPYPPDANVGLVAAGEAAVYEELGGWIKRTNAEVEATHRAIRWVPPHEPEPQRRPLQRFVPTVDGDVLEWPKALAIKPTMVTSLVDEVRADHIYFLSWDGQYIYLAGDIAATLLEHPPTEQARAWERDYLSIQLSPVKARETHGDSALALFIYPIGGGRDQRQPYAARWHGPEGYRPMPLRVVTRRSSRGFTIEARIPGTAVWGFKGRSGDSWRIKLRYQNVKEIYQTTWQGIVTLRP